MSSSGASPNIPSLKHTLSANASNAPAVHLPHAHARNQSHQPSNHNRPNSMAGLSQHSLVHGHGNSNVMHNEPNTGPPQMLRAVTATGVYNRSMNMHNTGPNANNPMASNPRLPGSSAINFSAAGTTLPTSSGRTPGGSSSNMQNWRMYLTIEERQAVRSKIRDAYLNKCNSYDDILQVVWTRRFLILVWHMWLIISMLIGLCNRRRIAAHLCTISIGLFQERIWIWDPSQVEAWAVQRYPSCRGKTLGFIGKWKWE